MFEKMNQKCLKQWILIPIFFILILWFIPLPAQETEGGDSPQEVFKAAQEAGAKKDFATLTKLVAPSQRTMMAFGTDMAIGMFVDFYEGENADEMEKKYEEIQNKYEIKIEEEDESEKLHVTQDTPQEVIDEHIRKRAQKLYGHIDAVKYVPDLMGIVINLPEMADQTHFPQEELTDLKIDGDHATGKAGDKDISFIRENDRWYLTADVMK